MMGTRYTICRWAINRSDPQNLLSVTLDVPLQSPYIHNCDGLCTRTDHHMLLPIVLHMVVPLYLK